jgi:hypothetical protein
VAVRLARYTTGERRAVALSAGWSRRSGAGVSARPSALIGAASTLPIHWHGPATSGREAFAASKTTSTNRWTSVRGRGWRRGARPLPPGTSAARATCLRRAQCGHEACRRCRRSPPAPHGGHGWVRVACAVANWSAWATTARSGRTAARRTHGSRAVVVPAARQWAPICGPGHSRRRQDSRTHLR